MTDIEKPVDFLIEQSEANLREIERVRNSNAVLRAENGRLRQRIAELEHELSVAENEANRLRREAEGVES